MWFHIAGSAGFFATDEQRLGMILSDTYYVEDVEPIPPGQLRLFTLAAILVMNINPYVEDSSESSSSESEEQNPVAEQ